MKTVSLGAAKQLKEAVYPQESEIWWHGHAESDSWFAEQKNSISGDGCSMAQYAAPTADEIIRRLPYKIGELELYFWTDSSGALVAQYYEYDTEEAPEQYGPGGSGDTLADAVAALWIQLKKQNLI